MISEVRNLGELVNIKTGRLDANAMEKNGKFPFFTCAREIFRINNYAFDTKAILLAGNNASGDFNVKYYDGKFNAYQRTYVITINDENQFNYSYLKHKLEGHLKVFKNQALGANTRFLKIGMIKDLQIPLPSLDQQKKIAAILDAADTCRQKTKALIEKYDELTQSLFLEMFGDPVTNSRDYYFPKLKDVCKVSQGMQIAIKHRHKEFGPNRYKYLTVAYLNGRKDEEFIENPRASVVCSFEDILMTRTGSTGKVITNVEGVFHNNFFKVDWDRNKLNKIYFVAFLSHAKIRLELLKRASTTTIPDLNHGQFYDLNVIVPKKDLQNQFAERVQAIEAQKAQAQASLAQAEDLFNSLLQKAFKGELV